MCNIGFLDISDLVVGQQEGGIMTLPSCVKLKEELETNFWNVILLNQAGPNNEFAVPSRFEALIVGKDNQSNGIFLHLSSLLV